MIKCVAPVVFVATGWSVSDVAPESVGLSIVIAGFRSQLRAPETIAAPALRSFAVAALGRVSSRVEHATGMGLPHAPGEAAPLTVRSTL